MKPLLEILLVEDDPHDVRFTIEALADGTIRHRLTVARDGEEALALLASKQRPDLILLDLRLPRMDGLEVLAAIKQDRALCSIPVVILSASAAEKDVARAYELQANCFVTKSANWARLASMIQMIENIWLLPRRL